MLSYLFPALGVTEPHPAMPVLPSACHGHSVSLLNDAGPEEHLQIDSIEQRQRLVHC